MFVGKARSLHQSEAPERCFSLATRCHIHDIYKSEDSGLISNICGKNWAWHSRFTSDTLFQILVLWVTISVWPFSASQHHLLYSSIPQEESQHVLLGMVQHFMSHVRQQQSFCLFRPQQGSEDLINSSFGGFVLQHSAPCILVHKAKYLSLHILLFTKCTCLKTSCIVV